MKTYLKTKSIELVTSGKAILALRLFFIFAVVIASLLFPEVAAAGPKPGPSGG